MQQLNTYEVKSSLLLTISFFFLFSSYVSRVFKEATAYLELRDPLWVFWLTSKDLEGSFVRDWRFDNLSWSQFDSKNDFNSVCSIVERMAYDGQLYGLVGSWGMQRYSFLVNCLHLSSRRVGENKQRTKRTESATILPRNLLGNHFLLLYTSTNFRLYQVM